MLSQLFTARVDARPLGVTRIIVGLGAIALAYDSRSLLRRASNPRRIHLPATTFLPAPSLRIADAVFAALVISGAALAIGLMARAAAAACAVLALTPVLLDQQTYSNHGVLLAALAAILVLSDPARALSFRIMRRRDGPGTVAYWPVLLLKTQLGTLYAWAAIAKVNESYMTDETLRSATASWLRDAVPDGGYLVAALAVLASEAFLAVGLWFRRTRALAFVVGAALHLGLVVFGWAPLGLVPFALLVLAPYPLFTQDPIWHQTGLDLPHLKGETSLAVGR